MPKYTLVLIDRDGVINKKPSAHTYITSWKQFLFLPEAKEALKLLSKAGYKIGIISNQPAIAKGLMSIEELDDINKKMIFEVAREGGRIDKVYFCPHSKEENCYCRKPRPGMILQALKDFNTKANSTIILGDFFSDYETAKNVGCDFIHINTQSDEREEQLKRFKEAGIKPKTFSSLRKAALWLSK
jgi:histidinol-phosphate phosphatase family protein